MSIHFPSNEVVLIFPLSKFRQVVATTVYSANFFFIFDGKNFEGYAYCYIPLVSA